MWPYAIATLRGAWRSPLIWSLVGLGTFVAWFGSAAAVLALDDTGAESGELIVATAQLVGVVVSLWVLVRAVDEDRHAGFARAADAMRPGRTGRLLGRWAGSTLAGAAAAYLAAIAAAATLGHGPLSILLLCYTSILPIAHTGAWALVLGGRWAGAGGMLAALALWACGHLPWGVEPLAPGDLGLALRTLLPAPQAAGGLAALGYTSAAVGGLLLLALALSPSTDA